MLSFGIGNNEGDNRRDEEGIIILQCRMGRVEWHEDRAVERKACSPEGVEEGEGLQQEPVICL